MPFNKEMKLNQIEVFNGKERGIMQLRRLKFYPFSFSISFFLCCYKFLHFSVFFSILFHPTYSLSTFSSYVFIHFFTQVILKDFSWVVLLHPQIANMIDATIPNLHTSRSSVPYMKNCTRNNVRNLNLTSNISWSIFSRFFSPFPYSYLFFL